MHAWSALGAMRRVGREERRTEREEAKHERGDDCEVRQRMQDDCHSTLSSPPVDPTPETEFGSERDRSESLRLAESLLGGSHHPDRKAQSGQVLHSGSI